MTITPPPHVQAIRQGMDQIVHRSFQEHIRFIKASGLSLPQFNILMQLHYQQTCGISDIGARMEISNAAASQLVEKLVQAGLLERTEDPNDRRIKPLRLTAQGRQQIAAGLEARYRWVDELINQLEAGERTALADALQLLTARLSAVESAH